MAIVLAAWGHTWSASPRFINGFIALLGIGLAAELSSVKLNVGSSTLSIAFIPFLAAAFLFDAIWAMVLCGLTLLVAEALFRRKPLIKVVFNTAKEILTIGFAASAYTLLGGEPSVDKTLKVLPVAIFAAGVAYSAGNSVAVGFAISLSEGLGFKQAWTRLSAGAVFYDLCATPVPALLAYLYQRFELLGVVALSAPLFIVRHIYVQNLKLEQSNRDLLDLMVKAIEARDPYTSGHSQRVSHYARLIAKEAGISSRHAEQIATAALLHDVGKIYEDFAPLLRKEGRLTPDEKKILQSHPVRSADLVATISSLRGVVAEAVRHHHENYDGSGYPDGLGGERIPLGARIIMIADTLDAMTTDRPYRKALTYERVMEEVYRYSGRQFDPHLAQIAIKSATLRRAFATPTPITLQLASAASHKATAGRADRSAALTS